MYKVQSNQRYVASAIDIDKDIHVQGNYRAIKGE